MSDNKSGNGLFALLAFLAFLSFIVFIIWQGQGKQQATTLTTADIAKARQLIQKAESNV